MMCMYSKQSDVNPVRFVGLPTRGPSRSRAFPNAKPDNTAGGMRLPRLDPCPARTLWIPLAACARRLLSGAGMTEPSAPAGVDPFQWTALNCPPKRGQLQFSARCRRAARLPDHRQWGTEPVTLTARLHGFTGQRLRWRDTPAPCAPWCPAG